MKKKKEIALVLEGGGTRGVFTAGVLDGFMEDDIYLPYVIGVSAGACNAANYTAHQPGRSRQCMIDYLEEGSYVHKMGLLDKNKGLFDMDLLFNQLPNQLIPFDYNAFFQSKQRMEVVATDCLSGEVKYLSEDKNEDRLMDICRASSSLPFLSPVAMVDGIPMLDGGISEPIPIRRPFREGYKKCVIILTRNYGYRKKVDIKMSRAAKLFYRQYPAIEKSLYIKNIVYNKSANLIENLEKKGHIFVFRPEIEEIDRAEKDTKVLMNFYEHGYQLYQNRKAEFMEYLDK